MYRKKQENRSKNSRRLLTYYVRIEELRLKLSYIIVKLWKKVHKYVHFFMGEVLKCKDKIGKYQLKFP